VRTTAVGTNAQNLYLQWRNVSPNGGYDETLAQTTWRYGPANTGLVVWYNDTAYNNNNFNSYVARGPSWGVKGRMLVVDSHPDPYRDPYYVAMGYDNEGGDLPTRSLMRDAPFSLNPTVNFTFTAANGAYTDTQFLGRSAVSSFHDAIGYYPGAEYVSRGPGYPLTDTLRWIAKQWDASVVVPAAGLYPVKAPEYVGTGGTSAQEWYYRCAKVLNDGTLYCPGYSAGLGYNGGTGNPGDYGVQYGWHVEILSQAENGTTATLKIWNAQRAADQAFFPDKTTAGVGQSIQYTYVLTQNQGSQLSLFACAPIDTSKAAYVAGSVTNGAIPLPIPCSAAQTALASGDARLLTAIAGIAGVQSIGWTGNVATGLGTGFSFQVKPIAVGSFDTSVTLYDQNTYWTTLPASRVTVQPIADFTASATDVATNEVITFTNTSIGTPPLSYVWNFGDGVTSTLTSPTHAYTAAGSYTVTLTVTNGDGSDSKQLAVTVGAPAVASFNSSTTDVATNQVVTFTNTSTGTSLTFLWNFGDGLTSTLASPTHAYAAAGVFTVTLTAHNAYGPDSAAQTIITVGAPAVAGFGASATNVPMNQVITFTNTSTGAALTFLWDFGDGLTSTLSSPTHAYAVAGVYTVTLTAHNDYGPDSTASGVITVGAPVVANFNASVVNAKTNQVINFTNASTGSATLSYLWNFGDGVTSTLTSPTHSYPTAGTYTVTLTATNVYGVDQKLLAIKVTPYGTFLPLIVNK
jgi:PKD repeat protein